MRGIVFSGWSREIPAILSEADHPVGWVGLHDSQLRQGIWDTREAFHDLTILRCYEMRPCGVLRAIMG